MALLCCSAFLCSIKWHNCTSACPKASDVIHEHLASTSSSTFASSRPPSWAYWASWDQPQNSPCHHVHFRPDSPAAVTLPLPVRPRWFSDMVLSLWTELYLLCPSLDVAPSLNHPPSVLGCNNGIILWNCSRSVCSQTSTPGPCPVTATLSMWCELITVSDAAQATRHEALLKVSCNGPENMFGWCKSVTFGIKTSKTVILKFCGFMFFMDRMAVEHKAWMFLSWAN